MLFSIIRLLWGVAREQKKHPQRPAIATGAPRHVFVEYMGDPNVVSGFFCSFASFFGGNCFVRYVPKKCKSARNFGHADLEMPYLEQSNHMRHGVWSCAYSPNVTEKTATHMAVET